MLQASPNHFPVNQSELLNQGLEAQARELRLEVPTSIEDAQSYVDHAKTVDEWMTVRRDTIYYNEVPVEESAQANAKTIHETAQKGVDSWLLSEADQASFAQVASATSPREIPQDLKGFFAESKPDPMMPDAIMFPEFKAKAEARLRLSNEISTQRDAEKALADEAAANHQRGQEQAAAWQAETAEARSRRAHAANVQAARDAYIKSLNAANEAGFDPTDLEAMNLGPKKIVVGRNETAEQAQRELVEALKNHNNLPAGPAPEKASTIRSNAVAGEATPTQTPELNRRQRIVARLLGAVGVNRATSAPTIATAEQAPATVAIPVTEKPNDTNSTRVRVTASRAPEASSRPVDREPTHSITIGDKSELWDTVADFLTENGYNDHVNDIDDLYSKVVALDAKGAGRLGNQKRGRTPDLSALLTDLQKRQ